MNDDDVTPEQRDPRPTAEIVADAIATHDGDDRWALVVELHKRGTEVELRAAEALSRSESPHEREVACDILGQLGSGADAYHDECVALLVGLLADSEDDVVASAATALGHRKDERAVEPLVALASHPSEDVRFGVTFGLGGIADDRAVAALVLLSSDEDEDVRDWATFGLGSLLDLDTPEIRSALLARVDDENLDARDEAIVGLARRKAPEALDLVRRELEEGVCSDLIFEAAEVLGDPSLRPLLLARREDWTDEDEDALGSYLDAALLACTPKS